MGVSYVLAGGHAGIANLVALAGTVGEVTVVAVGPRAVADAAAGAGVAAVVWVEAADGVAIEAYGPGVAAVVARSPGAVFAGRRPADRVLAGYVAATLDAPVVIGCTGLTATDGALLVSQTVYGGIAERTLRCEGPVVVVADGGAELVAGGAVVEAHAVEPQAVAVTGATPPAQRAVDLTRSRRVVGVGAGLKSPADLPLIEGLASALGADVGCSRPVAEGLKWLPKDRYIGVSGAHITPDLYVAVAISGQLQHLGGCQGATTIVAINIDPAAPIMSQADYVWVGDLYALVPALIAALGGTR